MLFSTRYWVSEKQALLKENTKNLAEIITHSTVKDTSSSKTYMLDENLSPYLNLMSSTIDSVLFVTDNNGNIILASSNASDIITGSLLPSTIKAKLAGKEYMEVGVLNGFYTSREYTVAEPIICNDGQTRIGYIFASTSAKGLSKYLADNLQIFVLSALGILTLTFIALYLMTYRLVRPLRQMASAARSFGVGDFSARIEVHGQDEIAELASSLNNMAISLSSVEGMRRSFITNVSHELKTPMTTIAGFIDGILDGTIPDEKRSYYLKIVSGEVKRLSRLVKTMLDLSRIDNGELHLKPTRYNLTEQVLNVLLNFEQRIENKNITVEGLEDCPHAEVFADFDMVGQVVYNLVDNAIKFINEGGTLTVTVFEKGGHVHCSIRNTGAGIPANEMPHIFERFYKSDKSRSLDKNGMGLGLYIVKTVINLHHGEIVVRSAEGEYCEFEFWIPNSDLGKR